MINTNFICKDCRHQFNIPDVYTEKHNLDCAPYERVTICPKCKSENFIEFNAFVEKNDVAEQMLNVILMLNRCINDIKNVFGDNIKSRDLFESVGLLADYIAEMFDFIPQKIGRKILNLDTQKQLEQLISYLRGEL